MTSFGALLMDAGEARGEDAGPAPSWAGSSIDDGWLRAPELSPALPGDRAFARAPAPAETGAGPPFVDVAVATLAPLSVGGEVALELPGRALAQLDVGAMPAGYARAINGMLQGFGAYDATVARLVDGSLEEALVVRASVGLRVFEHAGFEVLGGYTHVALSGRVDPAAVADAGGLAEPIAANPDLGSVALSSHLHAVHVAVGWRWVVAEHLLVRANLGYMQVVGSSTAIGGVDAGAAEQEAAAALDELYTTYVRLPVLVVGAGYRF